MTSARIAPLSDSERSALMAEVRRQGETAAAHWLGLSRNLLARALARLPIRAGSILLIRAALAPSSRAPASHAPHPPQAA